MKCTLSIKNIAAALCILVAASACAPAAQPSPAPTKAAAETPKSSGPTITPAAAPPKAQSSSPKEAAKVRLGVTGAASDAAFFVANEKGYFKEQGIEVEITPFDAAVKMIPPLSVGQLDVGGGAPSTALYNAVGRDIPVKIVADKGSVFEKSSYQALMLRQDIYDSGKVKNYADLKGLKIETVAECNAGHVEVDNALKKGGLTLKDVEVVALPWKDVAAAFVGKSIDAGLLGEPYITDLQEKKLATVFKSSNEFYPNHQVAVVLYSPVFIKDKPEVAKQFMAAYLKAARDYNDAFVKKDKKAFDEVVAILAKNTAVKTTDLYAKMALPGLNPNGEVMVQSLKYDQDWYIANGCQKDKIDIDALMDQSFVRNAVQQLGPYK